MRRFYFREVILGSALSYVSFIDSKESSAMKFIPYFVALLIALISCKGTTDRSSKQPVDTAMSQISNSSVKENSTSKRMLFRQGYFIRTYKAGKQLKLDSLQSGFDSLQIRLWIVHGLYYDRELFVIKNIAGKWSGEYYFLQLDSNYGDGNGSREFLSGPEPLDVEKVRHIKPKIGWKKFIDSLIVLKILELPDMDEIPGMEVKWTHPKGYHLELATKVHYRFYSYYDPERFRNEFWQAANMDKILLFIYEQFNYQQLHK